MDIYPVNWNDSMVPPTVFRTGGTALTFDEIIDGIYGYRLDPTDTIHFQVQFSHAMKLNTVIKPHGHLANKSAISGSASINLEFRWTWANLNTSFPAVTPDSPITADFTDAAALTSKLVGFTDITPVSGQGNISSILLGSLERLNTGYTTNNIFLLGFDIHYEMDSLGSKQPTSK